MGENPTRADAPENAQTPQRSAMNDDLLRKMAAEDLDAARVARDPITQFRRWYAQAQSAGIHREDAMTLATVQPDGAPAARIVLYKDPETLGVDAPGFLFFTNYESDKAAHLEGDPRAALVFHWKEAGRQVRAEGVTEKLPAEVSDAYFASRPRGSQTGAWASPQSRAIRDRAFLERGAREAEEKYAGRAVPRPPGWGGYLLTPVLWSSGGTGTAASTTACATPWRRTAAGG